MDFYLLLKISVKNIDKSISKDVVGKCNQKHLDHGQKPATDALKACSKRII